MEQLTTNVRIKKCEIIEGKMEFEKIHLTSDECKRIKIWHDQNERLQLSLQSIQPQLFAEKTDLRITKDGAISEESALADLIGEVATRMKDRMIEKHREGLAGWDDEANKIDFFKGAGQKVSEGDWIDALNYIAMIVNLEKPLTGEPEPIDEATEETETSNEPEPAITE